MSRSDLIKDTKQVLSDDLGKKEKKFFYYLSSEGCIPLSKEAIKYYSDEGCLEACELLYDLNIRTMSSGANVLGKENERSYAFISISYDSLSAENKQVVKDLIKDGVIDQVYDNFGRGEGYIITLSIPITSNDLVGDVSDKLMELASKFVKQDVLYGRTNIEELVSLFPKRENGMYLDYITHDEITSDELKERINEMLASFYADDEGNLFYTEDLLRKHLQYKAENRKKR